MTVCSMAVCKAKKDQKIEQVLETILEALKAYVKKIDPTMESEVELPEDHNKIVPKIYFVDPVSGDQEVVYVALELDPEEFGYEGYFWHLRKTKSSKKVMDAICKGMKKHGSIKVCYDDSKKVVFKPFK